MEGKIDSSEDRRIGRFQKITHKEIAKAFEGGRAQELEVSISSYWVAVGVFFCPSAPKGIDSELGWL